MELSQEDQMRLNVLLAQKLQAVRIDESRMIVYALTDKGEANVPLNPTTGDDRYLRLVRQLLSTQVLGSPGGYPVYLKRWTRMGQARDDSLTQLLLLGEPEAVSAVVHAAGLTDELARRAWWAHPTAENARRMLERDCVASGSMGPVLAEYLLEFLPFEEEHLAMIDSVRLILQSGGISADQEAHLWKLARRRHSYYVGFLQAQPDALPACADAHPLWQSTSERLAALIDQGNPFAAQLARVLSAAGQGFVETAETTLRKPTNQDVVVALLNSIGDYFRQARPDSHGRQDMQSVIDTASAICESPEPEAQALGAVLEAVPECREALTAMIALSMVDETVVDPIFSRTDAIGSVMRRKLEPVATPLREQLARLRSGEDDYAAA